MAQSLNKVVDLQTTGTSYLSITGKVGKFLVGDHALEFYADRNVEDYIHRFLRHGAGGSAARFALHPRRDSRSHRRCRGSAPPMGVLPSLALPVRLRPPGVGVAMRHLVAVGSVAAPAVTAV